MKAVILSGGKLAQQIESELRQGRWNHCAVYEEELQRLWPLEAKDRQAKIAEFAETYGFRLRFYQKGLCAIFDKWHALTLLTPAMHAYEIRPSKDHRGGYAMHRSGSHDAVIRVYDEAGNVIETHEQRGEFKEW